MIKITSCQYQLEKLNDWQQYIAKITALVLEAKQQQSQLLLFPEYAGVEIVCGYYVSDEKLFQALQPLIPRYIDFYKTIAQQYQLYIQPGTIIEQVAPDQYVNRAYFFAPNGTYSYQDKLQLTEFEKSLHILKPGEQQNLFKTVLGTIGIAICYDSEFPEIVRALTTHGAELILVPSYTSTLAGYHRVFLSCRARAIENQCYIATAYIVNKTELSGAAEETFGQAAVLGPVDQGFPDDGILAQGAFNKVMSITTALDLEKLQTVRQHGQVHNFSDYKDYLNKSLPNPYITLV